MNHRLLTALLIALLCLHGCADDSAPTGTPTDGPNGPNAAGDGDTTGPTGDGDATGPAGDGDMTSPAGDGDAAGPAGDGDMAGDGDTAAPTGDGDGSVNMDAGTPNDAATPDGNLPEAGLTIGVGSCCAAHATPGCSNAALQVCVCEKLPSCCTEGWTEPCALIVEQKYCQEGVRECVCGPDVDAGQWDQSNCCMKSWTNFCDTVAESKCNATPGCS